MKQLLGAVHMLCFLQDGEEKRNPLEIDLVGIDMTVISFEEGINLLFKYAPMERCMVP